MGRRAIVVPVDGSGPFLWLNERGPRRGFRRLPPGGMCLSAFVFVEREGRILLGRYADDPRWEELTGLDEGRWRAHGKGWTLPATHLRFGEDPRAAGRRVLDDVLGLRDVALSEPRVMTDVGPPWRGPARGDHYDVMFLMDARLAPGRDVARPPWYTELAWHEPSALSGDACARGHGDVVAQWRRRRGSS